MKYLKTKRDTLRYSKNAGWEVDNEHCYDHTVNLTGNLRVNTQKHISKNIQETVQATDMHAKEENNGKQFNKKRCKNSTRN